ncbi:NaeI family type II restriction endonuclease [Grimontia hollisae]|nr:NaeI family type II restriction endonuclease [Grimontia hollisae]
MSLVVQLENDDELAKVVAQINSEKRFKERFISTIRQSIDEVIDGPRTGRYAYDQLEKTEKTYLGTKIEILVRSEFGFELGEKMDYRIGGIEVDCKYTGSGWGWNIPKEAIGHLCLLVRADDKKGRASVGLIRATPEVMNKGKNQDGKGTISKSGREAIHWFFLDEPMPLNQLFIWSDTLIDKIKEKTSGQQRLNEMFRLVQGVLIERETIATIAQAKDDPMKRVRANGGARSMLASEGIIILGHQNDHPRICRELALPVPTKGQVVAVRVVPGDGHDCCYFAGNYWRKATESDEQVAVPVTY